MVRQLIISVFVTFLCVSIFPHDVSSQDFTGIYAWDTTDCIFPFNYNGQTYNNCTTDGSLNNVPWCSLTTDYIGQFIPCFDFSKPLIKCNDTYTVNGKSYTGCNLLSRTAKYKQCATGRKDYPYLYCPDAKKEDRKKYPHRRNNCDSKYKNISPVHTKCFQPSPFAVNVAIDDDEQRALLDMHDYYRSLVKAEHMFKLYWDDKLADMARARGELCVFDHDLADNRVIPEYGWKHGQNMVWTTEIRSATDSLIDAMLGAEKERFAYGVGCKAPGACLHYTQAMISNLTRMGCAHTHCVYDTHIDRYLTCNYAQSQYTSKYTKPYVDISKSGVSKCPKNLIVNGVCDCGNVMCNHNTDQQVDPTTCKCSGGKSKRSAEDDAVIAAPARATTHLLEKRSANPLKRRFKIQSKN